MSTEIESFSATPLVLGAYDFIDNGWMMQRVLMLQDLILTKFKFKLEKNT